MNSSSRTLRGLSYESMVNWARRCSASALAVASMLGWSASAQTAVYNVYTNNQSGNGAMERDETDDYCSLAEAVDSVNAGSPQWGCKDAFPGSGAIIQFWEGSGGSFSQNHFDITKLIIKKDVVLFGSGAYIDSEGSSGLVIRATASVEVHGLTLTHTGSEGGRLIYSSGKLAIFNSTLQNGDVSGLDDGKPSSGGALYNAASGVISYVGPDVIIRNNKAKRGGGIYNSTGVIEDLRAQIVGNTATQAGGGIYNQSTYAVGMAPKGRIRTNGAIIDGNSAASGGGVFNKGKFYMSGTEVTNNSASGTDSGERTPAGQSLDGAGGGIVSSPFFRPNEPSLELAAELNTGDNSIISSNEASGYGGGVYNAAQANLVGVAITDNRAESGAAIFSVPQGLYYYCQVGSVDESATINDNTLHAPGPDRYSILDGILVDDQNLSLRRCSFTNTTASGNTWNWAEPSDPYCSPEMVRSGSVCPQ